MGTDLPKIMEMTFEFDGKVIGTMPIPIHFVYPNEAPTDGDTNKDGGIKWH